MTTVNLNPDNKVWPTRIQGTYPRVSGSPTINKITRMNSAFNFAHKAAVGTLVFFSVWGTYSVAGGTGIVIKRRWDRKYNTDNTLDQEEDTTFLTPVQPTSLPDLDAATIKRVD